MRMKKLLQGFLWMIVAALFVLGLAPTANAAAARHALVIGNSAYPSNALPNPERDARLIASRLQLLGFEVDTVLNASQRQMLEAVSRFEQRLNAVQGETVSFAYFAGHGVQIDGNNFLLPVDFNGGSEGDARRYGVNADELVRAMDRSRSAVKFLVLDACRDNPFANRWRSAGGGLAQMQAPAGTLIAYSTSPGQVALDGSSDNSPYTLALADALLQPELTAERAFKLARSQVIEATGERQVPWDNSSLYGEDFYFVPEQAALASADIPAKTSQGTATQTPNPLQPPAAESAPRTIHRLAPDESSSGASTSRVVAHAAPPGAAQATAKQETVTQAATKQGPKRVLIVAEGAQELSSSILSRVTTRFNSQRLEVADPYNIAAEQGVRVAHQVSLNQAHRLARASQADYLIHASVRIVGEQPLRFYGRQSTQFIAELVINSYDVRGQRQLGPSFSKTLRYTSINALEQGRAAVDELMPEVNQTFARLY